MLGDRKELLGASGRERALEVHDEIDRLLVVDAERSVSIDRHDREIRDVVGLSYVLSGSRSGAEDLAQDAFVAAYRLWDRISGYENPGAWVRRVAVNRSISVGRRRLTALASLRHD